MLDTTFLLEADERGWPASLSAPFPDACAEANWLAGEPLYDCATVPSPDGPLYGGGTEPDPYGPRYGAGTVQESRHVVPVGSVEFVDGFLARQGLGQLQAMNIPPELEHERFLGRRVFRDVRKETLPQLEAEHGPLLVKPGRRPKLFEAARASDLSVVPNDEPLFVSQLLQEPIVAEWRVFILRGRVLDIRPYIMDRWVCPGRAMVEDMARMLRRHAALALDVGVLETGRAVAIECHPFIACGLYGFEGPNLLRMAKSAWLEELRRQGRNPDMF